MRMRFLLFLAVTAHLALTGYSQTVVPAPCCTRAELTGKTAVASGRWSAPATWGGTVPASGAKVIIPTGVEVTLDTNPPPLGSLFVQGTLRVAPRPTQLTAGWIMVHGLFEAGTAANPFPSRLTITLTAKSSEVVVCSGMNMGSKFITAMNGGRLSLFAPSGTAWTRLAADALPGALQIQVDQAEGWKPGDTVVIAPRVATPGQTEQRTIKAVSGNLITLNQALAFAHTGTDPFIDGRRLEMRSEVARLDRQIIIQGDTASETAKFGGHVMIMAGGFAQLDGIGFVRMGQFNQLGRYPFHWHLLGDAKGQFVRNSVVRNSYQRGIVVHGTRQTLVENNVVYASTGHNFAIEDPTATGNVLKRNLAIENRVIRFTATTLADQGDNQAANFWIRAAQNTLTDNVAAASMANGFWYDKVTDGPTEFRNNTGHSSYSQSIFTDFVRDSGLLVENIGQHRLEFNDSILYQNNIGLWPTESGAMTFRNFVFADHWIGPAMTMDTDSSETLFVDPLFVGRTRQPLKGETGPGVALPPAMLIQYTGLADVRRPIFANYGSTSLLSANDIFVEWQAQYILGGVRLLNTALSSRNLHDAAITTLTDTSYGLPVGTYTPGLHPQLASPDAEPVSLGDSGDYFRMPTRLGYAKLRTEVLNDTAGGDYSLTPWHSPEFYATRSDGLRFQDPDIDGFRMICGGTYSYALEQAPPHSIFFLTLDSHGIPMPTGVNQTVTLSLPMSAAPSQVGRVAELNDSVFPIPASQLLTPANSLGAFEAAPATSYFYDVASKRLYLQADSNTLIIAR